jgi:DNA polymerase-1
MKERIVIIDGNSLINRAYYAMQRPMITKEGLYTQGVYGFLNILAKIGKDYEAGYIAVAFDRKAPTFRHLEYDGYKAGRKKMPPELAMQLPILKDALDAMRIKVLEIDGYEADDIIGTVARQAEAEGLEPLVITGDKDELQLATDKTKVLITKKGISEFEIFDREAMVREYGFPPEHFIDYKGLMGDPSDNIPGLPGVGDKTARKLVAEYHTVENLLEQADGIQNARLREIIEQNGQTARMSKRLATIVTDVPIHVDFSEFHWEEPDYPALVELYLKLEFNSLLKKLPAAPKGGEPRLEAETGQLALDLWPLAEDAPEVSGEILDFGALSRDLHEGMELTLKVFHDDNHKDTPRLDGASVLLGDRCYFIRAEEMRGFAELLKSRNPGIGGHSLKEDYFALFHLGVDRFRTLYDTAVAQYLLDSSRSSYPLKVLAQEYCRQDLLEGEDLPEAGRSHCTLAARVWKAQSVKIREEGMETVLRDVELPLIEPMAFMEYNGFRVDHGILEKTGEEIAARIDALRDRIIGLAGVEFNINSPSQLGPVLFERLGLPAGKKTKTGYSTGAEILESLRDRHEIIPLILEYRMLTKLRGTYIEGLMPLIHRDGKIHAHFNQTVAATGRISSNEPNLQNIPIRQEPGRSLRKAFIPSSPDFVLLGADYSQIELRILAHLSGDPALIDAFNSGADIHRNTAARVLGIPEDQISQSDRSKAKAVNFGVIYGMSSFGLSSELNITRKEAEAYINEYFKKHEAVKDYLDSQVDFARKHGYAVTMMGRRRYIPEITASNYMVRQLGERLAMNSPIQGSAADIIKLAMIRIYRELRDGGYRSRLLLQVHDELILETHREELPKVEELLRSAMEDAVSLDVKVEAALATGEDWYDLK